MILVTGGTGLIGAHLLHQLVISGENVRSLYRTQNSLQKAKAIFAHANSEKAEEIFQQIEWIQGDILNIPSLDKAFQDVNKVYHCAALVSFDPLKDVELRKINIEGTANVVNFSIEQGVEKLCYVSSIATLDPKSGTDIIDETAPWNKENHHNMYAITKYGAEMEVWRGSQEGIPVIIVHPGVVLGPGNWHSGSGKLFAGVAKGMPFHWPKRTGFVGVWDLVQIMHRLVNSSITNEQYVVVAENAAFHDVLKKTASLLSRPKPRIALQPWMLKIGWPLERIFNLFSGRENKLDRRSAKSLFNNNSYSNQKVISHLNYNFQSLEEVLSRTALAFNRDFCRK